ncbi:larval/pupal cuticle protein H1C [Anopheles ziemanni]|uniref:larval/pupal cuticle protein H1C n=1 Tax=Anopheles coustani TaxID=139045 RepID=UPI002658B201|nr:larval/pupal cuticle protein H1C [Anopheles coustani]XP_058173804.1 larval/pupal cuticle protein H1C [Anopheles ziemanni]
MKFLAIAAVLLVASVYAEEQPMESMKAKRGIHFGLGYHHAPAVVSHSYVAPAPVIAHSAPLVAAPLAYHAPIAKTYVAHAPVVHHAPLAAYHAPLAVAHAPLYHHGAVYSTLHRR